MPYFNLNLIRTLTELSTRAVQFNIHERKQEYTTIKVSKITTESLRIGT